MLKQKQSGSACPNAKPPGGEEIWSADAEKVEEGEALVEMWQPAGSEADDQDADCTLTYIHQHVIKVKNQVHEEVGQQIISKTVPGGKGNLHS